MKNIKHYLPIILISIIPLLPLFLNSNMVHTHDGPVHIARIAEYWKILSDGQIPPRWAANLNYGYGTPLFIFLYPLPYALGAMFVALGTGLINSFKLLLAASYIISAVTMYAFVKKLTQSTKAALFSTILYQFAPYRFVQLFVRGSMAEAFAFSFLPLVLLYITKLSYKISYKHTALIGVSTALLILSHNSMSLVFFGIILLYVFIFCGKKSRFPVFVGLWMGLALAAFYWIPALLERKFTYGDLFMRDMYKDHFAPFWQFILPNLTNSVRLQTGGVAMQIGIVHIFCILSAIYVLVKKAVRQTLQKRLLWLGLTVIAVSLLFMQPITSVFWQRISILRQFQFPWRLLSAVAVGTSIIAIPLAIRWHPKTLGILAAGAMLTTVYYWFPPLGFDAIDTQYYWNYPLNTTYFGEADVIWSAGPASEYPNKRIEVIEGEASIQDLTQTTRGSVFRVTVQQSAAARLAAHYQYFPGWRVYIDTVKIPIEFQDRNWRGMITFTVPPGSHTVRVLFGESKVRLAADVISLVSITCLVVYLIMRSRKRRKKQTP